MKDVKAPVRSDDRGADLQMDDSPKPRKPLPKKPAAKKPAAKRAVAKSTPSRVKEGDDASRSTSSKSEPSAPKSPKTSPKTEEKVIERKPGGNRFQKLDFRVDKGSSDDPDSGTE